MQSNYEMGVQIKYLYSPVTLKTAISPDVECGDPKCTPDTSSSVSLWLNCENCVYFQLNFFMSCEYFMVTGYDEFHICKC